MKLLFPDITVNGQAITQDAIAQEVQNHKVDGFKPGEAWQKAARALIIRTLLLEEAERRKIEAMPEIRDMQMEEAQEALIRKLVEDEVDETLYDDNAVACEYAKRRDEFRSPDLYGLSHILIAKDEGAKDAREAEATSILAKAIAKPDGFASLAKAHSACPSAKDGGFLGQMMARDFVPEFRPVLPQLEVESVHAELVCSRFGWHILRLEQKSEGQILPENFAKDMLRESMEKYAWVKSSQELVKRLWADAEILGIKL